ncbi:MAG: hypothetical protein ACRD96_22435, partial [Bryobacteraceae bacterium]
MRRLAIAGWLCTCLLSAQKRPFDVHALLKLARIGDPQISPDGRAVAFTAQSIDLNTNSRPKRVYTVP